MKQNDPMKIIGITGGVGSGKSEVIRYAAHACKAPYLLADEVGHRLMEPGNCCYEAICRLFGPAVVNTDRTLDRTAIAGIVYREPEYLKRLNRIVHPAVRVYITEQLRAAERAGNSCFFLEAALLLEEHYDEICSEVWYIYADVEVRRTRLAASRQYSFEKIDRIMANQLTEAQFAARCAIKIDNSASFIYTAGQVDARLQGLGLIERLKENHEIM